MDSKEVEETSHNEISEGNDETTTLRAAEDSEIRTDVPSTSTSQTVPRSSNNLPLTSSGTESHPDNQQSSLMRPNAYDTPNLGASTSTSQPIPDNTKKESIYHNHPNYTDEGSFRTEPPRPSPQIHPTPMQSIPDIPPEPQTIPVGIPCDFVQEVTQMIGVLQNLREGHFCNENCGLACILNLSITSTSGAPPAPPTRRYENYPYWWQHHRQSTSTSNNPVPGMSSEPLSNAPSTSQQARRAQYQPIRLTGPHRVFRRFRYNGNRLMETYRVTRYPPSKPNQKKRRQERD